MNGSQVISSFDETTGRTVLAFAQDASGRLWLGTTEAGCFTWRTESWFQFSDDYLKKRNCSPWPVMRTDPSGWGRNSDCAVTTPMAGSGKSLPTFSECRALLVDRHGILWAGEPPATGWRASPTAHSRICTRSTAWRATCHSVVRRRRGESLDWHAGRVEPADGTEVSHLFEQEGLPGGSTHAVTPSERAGCGSPSTAGSAYFNGSVAQTTPTESPIAITTSSRRSKRRMATST